MEPKFTPESVLNQTQAQSMQSLGFHQSLLGYVGFFLSLFLAPHLLRNFLPQMPLVLTSSALGDWIVFGVFCLFTGFCVSLTHEVARAITAKWLGLRVVMIAVGAFALVRIKKGWRIRRVNNNFFALYGSVFMLPTRLRYQRRNLILVFLGGIAALCLLLISLITVGVYLKLHASSTAFILLYYSLLGMTWLQNQFYAFFEDTSRFGPGIFKVINLLRRTPESQRKLQYQLFMAQHDFGIQLSDTTPITLESVLLPADNSLQEFCAHKDGFARAVANNDPTQAAIHLQRQCEIARINPLLVKLEEVAFDAAFFEAAYGGRPESARRWLAMIPNIKRSLMYFERKQERLQVEAAVLMSERNLTQANLVARQSLEFVEERIDLAAAARAKEYLLEFIHRTEIEGIRPEYRATKNHLRIGLTIVGQSLQGAIYSFAFCGMLILMLSWGITYPIFSKGGGHFYNDGLEKLQAEEYDAALSAFDQAAALSPNMLSIYESRAQVHAKLGDFEKAITDLEFVISNSKYLSEQERINKTIARMYIEQGETLYESAQYEPSIDAFNRAIERWPNLSTSYWWRGTAHASLRNWEQAIADYDKSIELGNDDPAIYSYRAEAYVELGNETEVIANFERAINFAVNDREQDEAMQQLGQYYFDQAAALANDKKYNEAIDYYDLALTYSPNLQRAYWYRGAAYGWLNEFEQALADYTTALEYESDDNWHIHIYRGSAYSELERYDEALADYTNSIELRPEENWLGYQYRGRLYVSTKEYKLAEVDFLYIIDSTDDDKLRADVLGELDALRKLMRNPNR